MKVFLALSCSLLAFLYIRFHIVLDCDMSERERKKKIEKIEQQQLAVTE